MRKHTDSELLDWMANNPQSAIDAIGREWIRAVPGYRETYFDFRSAITVAMRADFLADLAMRAPKIIKRDDVTDIRSTE